MYGIIICSNGNKYVAKTRRHFKWLKWHFGWIYGLDRVEKFQ